MIADDSKNDRQRHDNMSKSQIEDINANPVSFRKHNQKSMPLRPESSFPQPIYAPGPKGFSNEFEMHMPECPDATTMVENNRCIASEFKISITRSNLMLIDTKYINFKLQVVHGDNEDDRLVIQSNI